MRTVLFSTYELGRQSFGLGSAAAWLRAAGAEVEMHDLALCAFDPSMVRDADFVGVHVPMHTATRLAEGVLRRIAAEAPEAHVVCFGLYAPMNDARLRAVGADTVLGGEFENDLVAAWRSVAGADGRVPPTIDRSIRFLPPDRVGLPELERYGQMQPVGGASRVTGYTEATRGCKHLCRHCPVVPVYQGRFVVVEPDVVLADVRAQVGAGARHITFGDPDFFNGPAHALRVVRRLHDEFPDLTYDVTIKVEHLRKHADLLEELAATGCILVTSAVESFDEAILDRFDKGHTDADLEFALAELRRVGLPINPTFVTFTPWTTVDGYLGLLARVAELGLVGNVAPIQYAIRLLIPAGSLLLQLDEVAELVDPFDEIALVHPWRHPDRKMDQLHEEVLAIARGAGDDRTEVFRTVWAAARALPGAGEWWAVDPPLDEAVPVATVPYLTEPWYC